MKLKAVLEEDCSAALVALLESASFRAVILEEVLRRHLRVGNFGPAEFYIQKCDFACGSDPMCEVRLTGVSVNKKRATQDFENALMALENIYRDVLRKHVTKKCQLFVSLMTDRAPMHYSSTLLEREPVYILPE